MPDLLTADLLAIFLVGLLGSAHCVGMCGGFVVAIAQVNGSSARRLQLHQTVYYLGKTLTYAVLGALAGAFGAAVGALLSGAQQLLSIGLGVFLVLVGLGLVGMLRRFAGPVGLARLPILTNAIGRMLRRRSRGATFSLGLLNGLLPCGLVYAMMAMAAATGRPAMGALTMAVFGLSTIPALYLVAITSFLLRPAWRARLQMVSGVLVIAIGLLTIVRGTPALDAAMQQFHGDHHAPAERVEMPHAH